jgi:hypothetical protein
MAPRLARRLQHIWEIGSGRAMAKSPFDVKAASADAPSLYVNYFEVAQNPYEFLIELGQYRPGREAGHGSLVIHTRVAMSPPYAKMLSAMLARAVEEHEKEHGAIASINETSPFDVVLQSLPEFEARARGLRARARADGGHPSSPDAAVPPSLDDR